MDSIKSLMDKKQYDLVVTVTNNATDSNSLFYRVSALLALGKSEDALSCIVANRKILRGNLALLIKTHIEILCILQKFDEAYEEMEYYKNLPYESQVVEETLTYYSKYIREQERGSRRPNELEYEEIIERINSDKPAVVLTALEAVRGKDVNSFLPSIKNLLVKNKFQTIRSFALLLLVEKKVNENIQFLHVDKVIEINPALLMPPFVNKDFANLAREVQTNFKDPALSENAINIYSNYLIYIYPDAPRYDTKEILCALYGIASSLLQVKDVSLEEKCLAEGVEIKKVNALIDEINASIEDL